MSQPQWIEPETHDKLVTIMRKVGMDAQELRLRCPTQYFKLANAYQRTANRLKLAPLPNPWTELAFALAKSAISQHARATDRALPDAS